MGVVKHCPTLAHPQFFLDMYMCVMVHVHIMEQETPDEVRAWFLAEVERLWPLAGGSLSLRKNRCIRPTCQACLSGEGHPAYALHYRIKGRQSSLYVPDDLVEEVQRAVANGRALQELMVVAGTRYVRALKATRRGR